MDNGFKIAFYLLAPLAVASLFVPIVTNPEPKDCNNYPDGTGGYYLKCKDEYISLFAKMRMKKSNPSPKDSLETPTSHELPVNADATSSDSVEQ